MPIGNRVAFVHACVWGPFGLSDPHSRLAFAKVFGKFIKPAREGQSERAGPQP